MTISFQEANQAVGCVRSMHAGLIIKNYYLPNLKSAVITCEYFLNVALGKCFRVDKKEVRIGQIFKKVTKVKLFGELERICQQKQLNLGITQDKLPDKQCLANILFTLDEKNEIFQTYEDQDKVIGLTKDDLDLLKGLDTAWGRKKQLKFFKRSHLQVAEHKIKKTKQKLQNIKVRLSKKKADVEKIEQIIRQYQIRLQNTNQLKLTSQTQQDSPIFQKQLKNDYYE